jgi:hypothetical protein
MSTSETVKVEMSRQSFEFLKQLSERIATQDNRGTAKPYFYVIQRKRWRVAREDYASGETRRLRLDLDGDPTPYYSKKEWLQHCREYEIDAEEAERKWSEMEEFTEEAYEEEENCFFTQKAYEDHLLSNGHNLRGERWSFLKHAFRNPEMAGLFQVIDEFRALEVLQ